VHSHHHYQLIDSREYFMVYCTYVHSNTSSIEVPVCQFLCNHTVKFSKYGCYFKCIMCTGNNFIVWNISMILVTVTTQHFVHSVHTHCDIPYMYIMHVTLYMILDYIKASTCALSKTLKSTVCCI